MKKTFYFPHDYHARHDPKMERLYFKLGYEGWGIYWYLIEMLYEQGGYLCLKDIPTYCKESGLEKFTSVIRDFNLFETSETQFWSNSCLKRLEWVVEKSQKATKSINSRWKHTNELPTNNEGNTIKDIKESKVNINDLRLVINKLVEIKGWDKNDSALITDVYKRHSRSAKSLLLVAGSTEKAVLAITNLNESFVKKGLSWTLETVIKWYPEFSKKPKTERGDA